MTQCREVGQLHKHRITQYREVITGQLHKQRMTQCHEVGQLHKHRMTQCCEVVTARNWTASMNDRVAEMTQCCEYTE